MFIFQTSAQEFNLFNWLLSIIPFILMFGGFISFVIWERRKKSLELEKLTLEIQQLKTAIEKQNKEESRIYKPNLDDVYKQQRQILAEIDNNKYFTGGVKLSFLETGEKLDEILKLVEYDFSEFRRMINELYSMDSSKKDFSRKETDDDTKKAT